MKQPVQARSRRTLDAILEATEGLLRDKPFEEISVAEIILAAGSSTGSFYARFPSKEALLPALYERYHRALKPRQEAAEAAFGTAPSLASLCEGVARAFAESFRAQPNLMRAIVLYARTRSEELAPLIPERAKLHDRILGLFAPFHAEIAHDDPEAAVRAGLFVMGSAIREAMLFPGAPMAANTGLSAAAIQRAAAAMLHAFLTTRPETS